MSDKTYARLTIQADNAASPVVHAFQLLRIAVVEAAARRLMEKNDPPRMSVSMISPGWLDVVAYADDMAALLAELEKAQVYAPVVLFVGKANDRASKMEAEDFAEYLRDRTDNVVVIASPETR